MDDERTQASRVGSLDSDERDDATRDGAPTERAPTKELLPGAALGRYAVLERIGAGAMGIVYAAYDSQLARKVAIKVVKLDRPRGATNGVPRLLREAQALAKLSHPNVVPIYDVGTANDRLFLAMELVEGHNLREWLARRPRRWREIVTVMIGAGRGLAAAHAAQIVHRDFKPDNVLIGGGISGAHDGRTLARVTDFGLARGLQDEPDPASGAAQSDDSLSRTLTRTGAVMGTPGYMAPEQHFGRPAEPRSDQYAFCVTLFEALYGTRPFDATGIEAVARQKWTKSIVDTSTTRPVGMPDGLHELVLRGLEREPEGRFDSMNELVARMEALLHRRSRAPWIAAAAVATIVGGAWLWAARPQPCPDGQGELATVWDDARRSELASAFASAPTRASATMWPRVQRRLDDYAAAWVELYDGACRSGRVRAPTDDQLACLRARRGELAGVVEVLHTGDRATVHAALELVDSLGDIDACADPARQPALATAAIADDPTTAGRRAAIADELAATRAHVEGMQYAAAIARGKPALQAAHELGDPRLECELELRLGVAEGRSGNLGEAERRYTTAFLRAQEHGFDLLALDAAIRMVFLLGTEVDDIERAAEWLRHAETLLERTGAEDTLEHASLLQNASAVYEARGEQARAEQALRDALVIRGRLEPDDARLMSMLRNNMGTLFATHGRLEESLAMHTLARANRVARLGVMHPDVAMSDINLANVLLALDRPREGLARTEIATPVVGGTVGEFTPMMTSLRAIRGLLRLQLGLRELAALDFHAVLVFRIARLRADHPSIAVAWSLCSSVLDRPEDGYAALPFFQRALAIEEAGGEITASNAAMTRMNIGMLHLRNGEVELARSMVVPAFAELVALHGAEHPNMAQGVLSLARIEIERGHHEEALALLDRATKIDLEVGGRAIERPTVRFFRARALWELDRDRPAAHALARGARAQIAAETERETTDLRTIDTWLAAHPQP